MVSYPDLPLSVFPDNIDSFTQWLNIVATDGPLIAQYMAAMEAGNQTLANQVLAQIPSATQKIITATDLNKLSQAILAIERFYKTDIEPYLNTKQQEWQNIINRFNYVGNWTSGTQYQENNIVSYTVSGLTMLFIATSTPPVGSNPNNTAYWRVLTIQGQQGVSGVGLSYRQDWSSIASYSTNDAVTYNNAVWMALKPSQNITPQPGSYWKQVISFDVTVYPIQPEQPTDQPVGGLWLNTSPNPTEYVYLAPLGNPATAEEIVTGYQAYDDEGNMITGTAPNLVPLDYPADAGDIFYGKQAYSEEGEVITGTLPKVTSLTVEPTELAPVFYLQGQTLSIDDYTITAGYSDGSSRKVIDVTYTPNSALVSTNTTLSVTYVENGVTVTGTTPITVYAVDTTLNNNSWDVICAVSNKNLGSSYWSVGDAKQITLNGTVGTKTYNNYQPWVFILGFNHNASIEGTNRIHFGCFKRTASDNQGVGLDDQFYSLGTGTSNPLAFHMQNTDTNTGGWASTTMRNTILGSNVDFPNLAPSNSLLSIFPSDLKQVMKNCIKYTDNNGGNTLSVQSVTPTEEWLWLLSVYEIEGELGTTVFNNSEAVVQKQYQYYKDGNSTIKFRQSINSIGYWWVRSPTAKNLYPSHDYCLISASGGLVSGPASTSRMVAPAFCV